MSINKYINYIKNKRLSQNTIQTYESSLRNMEVESNNWKVIKKNLFNKNFSNSTIRLHANILKNYFKFCKNKKMTNYLSNIKLPQLEVHYYRVLSKKYIIEKTKIQKSDSYKIQKWKTIIKFVFETGIRASELNNITYIDNKLFVLGKGHKKRQIFFIQKTVDEILHFIPDFKHKENPRTLRIYIKKIFGEKITSHSLRRSFATHMLNNGSNPKSLMLQMGHSKIETTFRYLNLSENYNHDNYIKIMSKDN